MSAEIEPVDSGDQVISPDVVLPILEPELRSYEVSKEYGSNKPDQAKEVDIVALKYDEPHVLSISDEINNYKEKEFLLTTLNIVPRPKVVPKSVPKVNKLVVAKKNETELLVNKEEVSKSIDAKIPVAKKSTANKKESVKVEPEKTEKFEEKKDTKDSSLESVRSAKENVIEKALITALTGKSFTVEMDQSGWIYEKEITGLKFKNKFYTSDRVLFEFQAEKTGKFEIQFTKYTDGNKSVTKVPVEISNNIAAINRESEVIKPSQTVKSISVKEDLENRLQDIELQNNPDEVYFKLAGIYLEEGYIKKSKEFYEYIYDNYPLSSYYDEAKVKMDYILDNFLLVR